MYFFLWVRNLTADSILLKIGYKGDYLFRLRRVKYIVREIRTQLHSSTLYSFCCSQILLERINKGEGVGATRSG